MRWGLSFFSSEKTLRFYCPLVKHLTCFYIEQYAGSIIAPFSSLCLRKGRDFPVL
ncbi:hypothetical protein HMPREF9080_01574 [Cardiobacterium valvarum F0432]|uniref:Uncharacterized protein n=1 Tax=Cardiobacterium valvarum F0432 TaxID=797473 RepID=G9ZFS2_9GAMM|nr:hypothetical protein HMPREF9080_01574 [Cardiobacterium valvarum F0432]